MDKRASKEKVAAVYARLGSTMALDEGRVQRFLLARGGDVDSACAMLQEDEHWRRTYLSSILLQPPHTHAAHRKAYLHGTSKEGMPIAVVLAGKHRSHECVHENVAFVVRMAEVAISNMRPGVQRIMVIVDFEDLSLESIDVPFLKEVIAVLERHYPERLGVVYLLDVPLVCTAAWHVVKRILDEDTRGRMRFVKRSHVKHTLLQVVEPHCLPAKYGGTSKYQHEHNDGSCPFGLVHVK